LRPPRENSFCSSGLGGLFFMSPKPLSFRESSTINTYSSIDIFFVGQQWFYVLRSVKDYVSHGGEKKVLVFWVRF
ncbi:MAG: hypothetical protein ACN4GR_07625, partial [Arenicellales bacterium]